MLRVERTCAHHRRLTYVGSDYHPEFTGIERCRDLVATDLMNPEYRQELLAVLARLHQLVTDADADAVLAGPGDAEIYAWMEDIREHLVEMRARVEAKLDRLAL